MPVVTEYSCERIWNQLIAEERSICRQRLFFFAQKRSDGKPKLLTGEQTTPQLKQENEAESGRRVALEPLQKLPGALPLIITGLSEAQPALTPRFRA